MKKYVLTLFTLILLAGTSCQEKIDIEKEKAAIIAVIEEETNAYYDRDFDRIAATYVQDETNIRLGAGKNGYGYYDGWEEIGSAFKEWIEEDLSNIENIKYGKTNYKIKVYNNSAWAVFDDKAMYDVEGEHIEITQKGVRFLEKVDGEWKIVFMSFVNTSSYEEEEIEEEVESETEETE